MSFDPIVYNLIRNLKSISGDQINTINDEINTINNNINDINNSITTINDNINAINDNINTINSSIDTINTNLSALNTTVNTILNDLKFYTESKDIAANDSYEITTDTFDIDFTKAIYNVKILDSDYYVDSSGSISIKIKNDGSSVVFENTTDNDLTVLINIFSY